MSEQEAPQENPVQPQSPAGVSNTSSGEDNRIPLTRFNQVMAQLKEAQEQLDRFTKAEEKRKLEGLSEAERAKAEAEQARQEAAQIKLELEAERKQRVADKRNNLVATALAAAQAIDADETVEWLAKHAADELSAAISADGTPNPDAIKALVDKARTERPHHFRPGGPGSPSNRSGEPPAANMDSDSLAAAAFLAEYGFKPNKERLATFMNEHRDKQQQSGR